MKAETIVKVAESHRYTNSRTRRDTLCVLISSAVRSGDIANLTDLIASKSEAQRAINLFREKSHKGETA